MMNSSKRQQITKKSVSNQPKTKQTIKIIKHFEPSKNKDRKLSDNLPECNIDNENQIVDRKFGRIQQKNDKLTLNRINSIDVKIINDKNPIKLSTIVKKQSNSNKDKNRIKTKQNIDKVELKSKSIKNERIQTNLSNIQRNSAIRLNLIEEVCTNTPQQQQQAEHVTYEFLKKIHNEIRNSRRILHRYQTNDNTKQIDHTQETNNDYVEKLKNEILSNQTETSQKHCELIEKLKQEIDEYRRNFENQSPIVQFEQHQGIARIMSPLKTIDRPDANLQTEDLNTIADSVGVTARDYDRIQETNSLMTQVRETLQDVKDVLSARRVEVVTTKDCGTSPPSTPANKSPENRTISLRDNDKIDEIIRKLENIGRGSDEEKFGSEKLRNSTVTEIAITNRASSPIVPLPELTDLPIQSNQIKSFTDKCIQNDCDLLVTSSRLITEDKCSGTDFEEMQIIEETDHQSARTKNDRIPVENREIIDKPHRLTIQHLPKINIARALVIQNALKLNIKPIEADITNNDRLTNIGYKEIKIEEKPIMLDCAIQLQTERFDKATAPLIFYDDKTVQVSDLESDRSIIANLNNNKETSELDRLSDDVALILKTYQISDLKYKQSSDLTISNATRSSRDSCSVNKTFPNQHALLQQSQPSQSPDNTAISDKISSVVEKSETITKNSNIGLYVSEAIQCDLFNATGQSIQHDSATDTTDSRRLDAKLLDFNALSTMFYNNSFDSTSSREIGEIGDFHNEPQCKCSNVSLGEVHNCRFRDEHFDITKQKTIYNNWVSYYLNRKSLEIVDTSQNSSS